MGAPELFAPSTTSGGAPVGGSGSPNTIPLWSTSTTLTDSALSQSGAIVTNSGTFRAANGTFSEPAYTFSGSSGMGMYRATSGALLRFAVSGAYAFGVDTNGNLGIGTTSPASAISANSTVLAVAAPGGNLGTVRVSNTSNFSGNHAELFAGTTGVGVWGSSNCPMLFYTNSVERMRMSATGVAAASQVAIGTTSFTSGHALTTSADADIFGVRFGRGAGDQTTNTVAGRTALASNTTGVQNTCVGWAAGQLISTGSNNTFIGAQAGQAETTGSQNVYIGMQAGLAQVGTTANTYIGFNTGVSTTGAENTAVGRAAFAGAGAATQCVAVGSSAGRYISGNGNTSIGYFALAGAGSGATGGANTACGFNALSATTTGANNSAIGSQAGNQITTGSSNVLLGWGAGNTLTTGNQNICIGVGAITAAAGDNNQLVVGSVGNWVATPTAGTYYATAGASLGYIQVRLNGANVKIQVFAP